MRERIRARFFPKWPEAVLFFIPSGLRLTVRDLEGPVGREQLQRACEDVQISEAEPGRWSQSILQARSAAKAERNQRHKLQEAAEAAVLRGSVDPGERDRAKLVLEKQDVDARCRDLKNQVARAKSDAVTRGVYMDPRKFRELERRLEHAKEQSQGLQMRLSQLRQAEKAKNAASHATFERAFMAAAREQLEPEVYEALVEQALEAVEPETPTPKANSAIRP